MNEQGELSLNKSRNNSDIFIKKKYMFYYPKDWSRLKGCLLTHNKTNNSVKVNREFLFLDLL